MDDLSLLSRSVCRELADTVREHLAVAGLSRANGPFKVGCMIAGMIAGADSIDDLDVLRHCGMGELFDGVWRRPRWAHHLRRPRRDRAGRLRRVLRRPHGGRASLAQ